MTHKILTALFLLLGTIAPLAPATWGQTKEDGRVDSILASVNGDPISLFDVVLETARDEINAANAYKGKELYNRVRDIRREAVERIVDRRLIFKAYEHESANFKIPDQYLENMVDEVAEDLADGTRKGLKKRAEEMGLTFEQLRERLKRKLVVGVMINEFCYRKVTITPKESYDYYKQHRDQFSDADQIELQALLIKHRGKYKDMLKATVTQIKETVRGADRDTFAKAVKDFSEGFAIDKGGCLGWVRSDRMRQEFAEALTNAQPGTVVGPVKTTEGIYFLRYSALKRGKTVRFKDVAPKITEELKEKARQAAYDSYVQKLRKDAVIRFFF